MSNNKSNIKIARQRIAEARQKKLFYLDLHGLNLEAIPDDISDMTFLLDLDISNNNFTVVPQDVKFLINLQYLNVSNNNIFFLDVHFEKHTSLKEINISNNSINFLPNELYLLSHETNIIFYNNPFLNNLPIEIENQTFFDVCYYLDLIKNQNDVYRFYETKLLFVGKGEVGKTTLAKVLKDDKFEFIQGQELTTNGIHIDSLSMNVLFPAHPPHYNTYNDIENVYLLDDDTNYENEDNIETELFFENLNIPKDKAAYISLGIEDYETYNINHISSELIHYDEDTIGELLFSDDISRIFQNAVIEKEVTINMWDFGGQEIYHTTHQFFLTKRSIYIFVWEPRKDYIQDEFDYWLNTIKLLSSNSPVLVVMNKSDMRYINIDTNSLHKKFDNIVSFVNVSCKTKEGITKLKDEIKKSIRLLHHMGNQIPKSWIKIRKEIKLIGKDFISYTEFIEISQKNGNIAPNKEINLLSEYLHDVGEIIHFKDDSILKNIVIINPQWATQAVYALIDTIPVQKNNGLFNIFDLENFWDLRKYPIEMHIIIVQLMEKFEICFKLIGAKDVYVIPELLQNNITNPKLIEEINIAENMRLQFDYFFMPAGIITKLICKLYSIIYKDNYWKNGAIFQHELSMGYVVNDFRNKVLYLVVSGEQKGNLLAIIRKELKSIHDSFNMKEGTDFKEKIPCICVECKNSTNPFYFEYDVLKTFLIKSKTQIPCNFSAENVDINLLISGYSTVKPTRNIMYEIISAASQLQGQNKNIVPSEDARNSFISDRLSQNGIVAKDQSHWGKSGTGNNQGKLDIKVEDGNGNIVTLFEGLILKSLDTTNLIFHIRKTINNYDVNGLPEKYLCVYYEGKNYSEFSEKYLNYLNGLEDFSSNVDLSDSLVENTEIKVVKSKYFRTRKKISLYHILINMT